MAKYQSGCALAQWKRPKEYRQLLKAPEGFTLCEWDAAAQEFRWMAYQSGDETMLSMCMPGEDAHSFMGSKIANVNYRQLVADFHAEDKVAANNRKLGKFCNLSFQYRVGAKTATKKARVEYGLEVRQPYVEEMKSTYLQTYRDVPSYWKKQILNCRPQGYAETVAGRRIQLKGDWTGRDKWGLESTAINYPIQGTGADQKYLALAVLKDYVRAGGGYFYFDMHDGLFYLLPTHKAEKMAREGREILLNLPYKQVWGVDLPIQFPWDASIGADWGHLKEIQD